MIKILAPLKRRPPKWKHAGPRFDKITSLIYNLTHSPVARTTLNATNGAQPFGASESIDIKTALRSQTIWAAHQMFLDDRIGSIEVGKDADIAVWDRDMYTVPTERLKDLACELTLLKGEIVFDTTKAGGDKAPPLPEKSPRPRVASRRGGAQAPPG